jgi:hypothetical protein
MIFGKDRRPTETELISTSTVFGECYNRDTDPAQQNSKIASSRDVDRGTPALDQRRIQQTNWVLTTYETLRDYHLSFAAVPFACVVFDEMQKVKSAASLASRAAKILNADFTLGLTGTPIENQLADLWSIMDIINSGCLRDLKSFSTKYQPDDLEALENLRASLLDASNDSGTQSTWSESWKSSEFITTGLAFTSRSVAALQEKDPENRRPPMPSLIITIGGTIAAVCSRCQSQHNYEFAMDRLIWLFSRPAAYRKGCTGDPGELAGRDRRRSTGQYHSPLHHGEHPLR